MVYKKNRNQSSPVLRIEMENEEGVTSLRYRLIFPGNKVSVTKEPSSKGQIVRKISSGEVIEVIAGGTIRGYYKLLSGEVRS